MQSKSVDEFQEGGIFISGGGDDWKEAACKIIYSDKSIASVGPLVCNRVCVCTLQYVQTMRAWITLSVLWDKNSTFATGKALLQQKKEEKRRAWLSSYQALTETVRLRSEMLTRPKVSGCKMNVVK